MRPNNPCRGIKRYPETKRERFLSADEFARLGKMLARVEVEGGESIAAIAAIRPLILTGCRLSEILTLRWADVDFDRACLCLPDVRLHDLRHSFAGVGAAAGMSLTTIGKMLGHTQSARRARYAHLAADPVKHAVEAVATHVSAAIIGKTGEVIAINLAGYKKSPRGA